MRDIAPAPTSVLGARPRFQLDISIEPVIPDNTAFTVLRTLRTLGYEQLHDVIRADHLLLDVRGSEAAPTPLHVVEALSRAEVLFNPNKHRLAYAIAGGPVPEADREQEALVLDKDESDRRLLTVLQTTFAMGYLDSIARGVVWRLREHDRPAPAERLHWACRELLCNPVSQEYQVRPRPRRIVLGADAESVGEQNEGAAKELR